MSLYISVIIDTFNYGRYISHAIESVLIQDFPAREREIIIIDDGSSDETGQIIEKYRDQVSYIYQENKGQGCALNTAFSKARGDIICLLDADDVWYPEKLKTIRSCFERDASMGIIRHHQDDAIGDAAPEMRRCAIPALRRDDDIEDLLIHRIFSIGTSALSFRKIALANVLPIPGDLRICPDEYLCTHLLFFTTMGTVPCALGARRLHGSNAGLYSHNHLSIRNLEAHIYIREALDRHLMERMRSEHRIFTRDVFSLSRSSVIRSKILLLSLSGNRLRAIRISLTEIGRARTCYAFFKGATLLCAALSPSLFIMLLHKYENSRLLPQIRAALFCYPLKGSNK